MTSGMSPHAMSRRLRWRGRDRPRCQSLQVPSACAGFCCIFARARGPMTKTPIDTNPATKLSWWQLVLIGVFTKRLVFSQTSKKIPALENLEDRSRKPRNRENHKPRDPWSRTSPHGRAVYEFVKIAKHQLTPINTNQAPIKHQSKHKNTTLTPRFCLKAPRFCRNFKMMREKDHIREFRRGGGVGPSESFAEGGVGPSESFAEVGSDRPRVLARATA